MCFVPIRANPNFRQQGDLERCHPGHQAGNCSVLSQSTSATGTSNTSSSCTCMIILVPLFCASRYLLHLDHAQFNQIGRRALHGRVDGCALQPRQLSALGGLDARQLQAPAKHGFHVALRFGQRTGGLHVSP